eukprot:8307-Heterococcus_DN1.PRE.2
MAPAGRPKASTAPGETDAADDFDEEEVDREVDSSYYSISEAQLAFVNAEIEKVKRAGLQTYDSFTVYPSNALTGSSAGALQHMCQQPLHIWAPQKYFVNEGPPSQPPCPVHGFTAVVQGKRELQQQYDLYHGDAAEKAAKLRRARSFHYMFKVYDPRVTRLYAERYTWVAVQMPANICSNRTAMTVELARLVKRSCVAGSNPTELTNLLNELRAVHFDPLRLHYYSYHMWDSSAERRGGSVLDSDGVQRKQLSMQQAFARAQSTAATAGAGAAECSKLPMLTAEAFGLSQLSHHLLHKFVLCVHAADADYQWCTLAQSRRHLQLQAVDLSGSFVGLQTIKTLAISNYIPDAACANHQGPDTVPLCEAVRTLKPLSRVLNRDVTPFCVGSSH